MMKLSKLPLLIGALMFSANGQVDDSCNVQVGNLDLETVFSGGFNAGDLTLLDPAVVIGGAVRLFDDNEGNRIAGFWFNEPFRLSDGFRATFTYNIQGGNSDGFAFVIQPEGTANTLANLGGAALGFSAAGNVGGDSFLGVAFDFCQDRPGSCDVDQIRVDTKAELGTPVIETAVDVSSSGLDSGTHNVRVDYLANTGIVEVAVDGTVVLTASNINVLNLFQIENANFGPEFGFVGFTGANAEAGASTPAEITISNLQLTQMNSGFRLSDDSISQEVSPGDGVLFTVLLVDECNNQIPPSQDLPDIQEGDIVGFLIDTTNTVEDIPLNVLEIGSNFITLDVTTDAGIESSYNLFLQINGVFVQLAPLENAVSTILAPPGGLSPAGIGLLSGLLALLVIAVIAIVMGVRKYRAQLIEHKDDIDHGRTKQQIDKIDKTIKYEWNPMAAPLDELKERLAANEKKIEQLKAEQKDAEDSDFHLTQLREENEGLRAQMAELRRKKEFDGVGNTVAAVPRKNFSGGNDKAEFGQDQV